MAVVILSQGGNNLQNSAFDAEVQGYGAEMLQFLKGNESGFSYEDLCSNHVGAMLFCNNYQEMVNGGLNWSNMLSNACAALKFTEPKNAPNYDFIPHIIDGNMPRVHSLKDCLTGDELYDEHCVLPLDLRYHSKVEILV